MVGAGDVGAAVQDLGPVDEEAPGRARAGHLGVSQRPEREVQRRVRHVVAVLVRHDVRGPVLLGDVGQVDEGRQLLVAGFGPRHDQAVAPVVTVQWLVIVDGTGVLGPELHLVEMEVSRLQVALGDVYQIGVHGQAVEIPRAIRKLLHTGELTRPVAGKCLAVGEVVLRAREVQPERFTGRGQLLVAQEPLHEREASLAHLGEGGVGDPHHQHLMPAAPEIRLYVAPTLTTCAR